MTDDGDRLDVTDKWFASNLKAARERAGLSQEALAQKMREDGFPRFRQQTVTRIESSERIVRGVGEAQALARAVGTNLDALARPPERTRDAMVLRGGTGRLDRLRDTAVKAIRDHAEAREMLAATVARMRAAGKAPDLADEIRDAERAIGETVTAGDEGAEQSQPASGPSQVTGRSKVT